MAMEIGRMLLIGVAGWALCGCGGDSNAMESVEMCFDDAPLPIGTSLPSLDAQCPDPPSAISAAVEARVRDNLERSEETAAELLRPDAITVVTCGSGSAFPSDRVQACTAVFVDGLFLLFDAGDGAERSMERLLFPVDEVDAVFLTHFHSDHIADVGEVISRSWILGRRDPLPVYGGEAVSRVVDGFNAIYALDDNYRVVHHGGEILPPQSARAIAHLVDAAALAGAVVFARDGVTVTAFAVNHPPIEPALGYRVDFGGRSVVISGDTTDTENLREMSRGADVLVSEVLNVDVVEGIECALRRLGEDRNATFMRDIRTYHIGTQELAELAAEAGVGTLLLTHQAPSLDNADPLAEAFFAAPIRQIFSGSVIAASDGTRVVIELD